MGAAFALIEGAITLIVGLINLFGATQRVSDMIANRIRERRGEWNDTERTEVRTLLYSAEARAADAIAALEREEGRPAALPPPPPPEPADPPPAPAPARKQRRAKR